MDLVLERCRIGTGSALSTITIASGRIAAIAPHEERGAGGRTIDIGGRRILPSFVDAHVHMREWAVARTRVKLSRETDYDRALTQVRAFERALAPGRWLLGGGWDENLLGRRPDGRDLGGLDRPIMIESRDGHALWCNDVALALAGVTRHTPDPPGGVIDRGPGGELTGLLYENAREPVRRLVPPVDAGVMESALDAAFPRLAELGISEIHDCSCRPEDCLRPVALALEEQGRLPLRVATAVPAADLDAYIGASLRTGAGSGRLRIGGCKQLADGTLGSRTAAMEEPFCGSPSCGIMAVPRAELEETARRAAAAGIVSWIHAIGDRCLREALEALAAVAALHPGWGHRIEHAQLAPPALLGAARDLGVTFSVQPIHLASDMDLAARHWGPRTEHAYNYGSMVKAGIPVCFGSDMPVEEPDPMKNLQAAVLRRRHDGTPVGGFHPAERLSLPQAIEAYTHGGSLAGPWHGEKGSIRPGQLADLVAWDPDPLAIAAEAIHECRAVLHVIDGQVAWQAA